MTRNTAVELSTDEAQADTRPVSDPELVLAEPELVLVEAQPHGALRIPRGKEDDYTPAMAARWRRFLREQTEVTLDHVGRYSFDTSVLPGNVENFSGVAQVPVGVAGPLRINSEHAQGDFYVPLATTEGTPGKGKARKLAEICAATVLAGEISLTSAVLAGQ